MKRKIIARVGATLGLSALPVIGLTAPAWAQTSLEICNSSNSVGLILVTSSLHPSGIIVRAGYCNSFYNADGSVRVDPDPEYSQPDVDSYRKGIEGRGYYECVNGEGIVNPPNDTNGLYWKINTDGAGNYC